MTRIIYGSSSPQKVWLKCSVLYISGLSPNTATNKLTDFIQCRTKAVGQLLIIYSMKIFKTGDADDDASIGARITVGTNSAELSNYSFWPGKIYACQWKFKRQPFKANQR